LTLLVGWQEGHPACKKMGNGGGGHWLVQMEWRPDGWSLCLPLLIFPCTTKSRSSLLSPADLDDPGKRAVKRLWCGCVVVSQFLLDLLVIMNAHISLFQQLNFLLPGQEAPFSLGPYACAYVPCLLVKPGLPSDVIIHSLVAH